MGVVGFGLGLSGRAINNPAKPLTPQGMCQTLPQKAKSVTIPEEKLLLIAYDRWGISFGIINQRVYQRRTFLLALFLISSLA